MPEKNPVGTLSKQSERANLPEGIATKTPPATEPCLTDDLDRLRPAAPGKHEHRADTGPHSLAGFHSA